MHKYVRRWINWSRVADIQAQRAIDKKNAAKQRNRGGTMSRRTRRKR